MAHDPTEKNKLSRIRHERAKVTKHRLWLASRSESSSPVPTTPCTQRASLNESSFDSSALTNLDVTRLEAAVNVLSGRLAWLETSLTMNCWIPDMSMIPLANSGDKNVNDCSWPAKETTQTSDAGPLPHDESGICEIACVCRELGSLNEGLCFKLYQELDSAQPYERPTGSDCTAEFHFEDRPSLSRTEPMDSESVDASVDEFTDYLENMRGVIEKSLPIHWQAAAIAEQIECGTLVEEAIDDIDADSLRAFLMEQYSCFVPVGIAKRRAAMEKFENELEKTIPGGIAVGGNYQSCQRAKGNQEANGGGIVLSPRPPGTEAAGFGDEKAKAIETHGEVHQVQTDNIEACENLKTWENIGEHLRQVPFAKLPSVGAWLSLRQQWSEKETGKRVMALRQAFIDRGQTVAAYKELSQGVDSCLLYCPESNRPWLEQFRSHVKSVAEERLRDTTCAMGKQSLNTNP